jgi:hypothetical protein
MLALGSTFQSLLHSVRRMKYGGVVFGLLALFAAGHTTGNPQPLVGEEPADASTGTVALAIGLPGAALLNAFTLNTGIPMLNTGRAPASNVQITSIALTGGAVLTSPSLPFSLGSIGTPSMDGGMKPLFADFNSPSASLVPGGQYTLTVTGTYQLNGTTITFTLTQTLQIPGAAPGSADSNTASAAAHPPQGPFAPQPPTLNEFDANEPAFIEPIGPSVPVTPSSSTSSTQPPNAAAAEVQWPTPLAGAVTIPFNQGLGDGLFHGYPQEPSGASAFRSSGNVVFITANSSAVYSTNGGSSFTKLDPTTIFYNKVDGGFCCDQIVQYVPSIDRFVWLMQFRQKKLSNGTKGPNLQRIAVASPSAIVSNAKTAWTYWNLTSDGSFGFGTNWLDYPDMSVGNNYLYVSCDEVGVGLLVIRIPLSQLAAGGTINFRYTHPTDSFGAYGGHLTQNTGDTIFWASHMHTSALRIFSWPESTTVYSWTDIGIGSYSNTGVSSKTPDGHDWLQKGSHFPGTAVIGATRSGRDLWLGWHAGTDSNFPQPHIELVDLDLDNNFNLKQQVQIWNANESFAYPALHTNAATGEIGISLEHGGSGLFENHAVGFWGDFLVYITTNSTNGVTRYGDYVTIRQNPTAKLFDAFGYEIIKLTNTTSTPNVHYVIFGRP